MNLAEKSYHTAAAVLLIMATLHGPGVASAPEETARGDLPRPKDTLTMADLEPVVSRVGSGEFPKDWVATPAAPAVIRKGEDAQTASYREGRSQTFLINSVKRPRVVCMDSGRLVLVATAWLTKTGVEEGFVTTSDDLGKTWSQPAPGQARHGGGPGRREAHDHGRQHRRGALQRGFW